MSSDVGENQDLPFLSTDQMREVDRAMVEDYGILLIQMMENAGRNLAHLARQRFLNGDPRNRRVLVLVGKGGNGGGGLVCARHLHNWGATVEVFATSEASEFSDVPRHQMAILRKMGIPIFNPGEREELNTADLIIDAIIGYSLTGSPTGAAAELILKANAHVAPVLALDAPSGLDTSSGEVRSPCIKATATMTLALPKQGLRSPAEMDVVGELYLADISIPPGLYTGPRLELEVGSIFAKDEIVRIW